MIVQAGMTERAVLRVMQAVQRFRTARAPGEPGSVQRYSDAARQRF